MTWDEQSASSRRGTGRARDFPQGGPRTPAEGVAERQGFTDPFARRRSGSRDDVAEALHRLVDPKAVARSVVPVPLEGSTAAERKRRQQERAEQIEAAAAAKAHAVVSTFTTAAPGQTSLVEAYRAYKAAQRSLGGTASPTEIVALDRSRRKVAKALQKGVGLGEALRKGHRRYMKSGGVSGFAEWVDRAQ